MTWGSLIFIAIDVTLTRTTSTALIDPAAARAYRTLHVELAIVDALAPLSPEARSRVLEATCILHGLNRLAEEIRAARRPPQPARARSTSKRARAPSKPAVVPPRRRPPLLCLPAGRSQRPEMPEAVAARRGKAAPVFSAEGKRPYTQTWGAAVKPRENRRSGPPGMPRPPGPTRRLSPELPPTLSRPTTGSKTAGRPPSWPAAVVVRDRGPRCWSHHLAFAAWAEACRRGRMGRA
jgi:hypothetical protein